MRINKTIVLCAALLATSLGSSAATTVGDVECAEWVNRNTPEMKSWLLGYMSGLNVQWASDMQNRGEGPLQKYSSPESLFRRMDESCRIEVHVGDKISVRGFSLFLEMQKQK
jgi:hypothetical protein